MALSSRPDGTQLPFLLSRQGLELGPSHSRAAESFEKNASPLLGGFAENSTALWRKQLPGTFSAKEPGVSQESSSANPELGELGIAGQGMRQRDAGEVPASAHH